MTCVICKQGKTAPGTTRMAVERGATVLVVRGVPAQVCNNCGEAYLGADAVDRLQRRRRRLTTIAGPLHAPHAFVHGRHARIPGDLAVTTRPVSPC
jgi:YgiT-type zinc finger domain-containing protein